MSDQDYFLKKEFDGFESKRIELMAKIAETVSQQTGYMFVLKGGTALLLAYGLPRFSTDLDFDGKDASIDLSESIRDGARNAGVSVKYITISKDTPTGKKYMLHYEGDENEPLKIETSYRQREQINEDDICMVDGIRIYKLGKLADLKVNAFVNRIKARDIYDVAFLLDKHSHEIKDETYAKIINRVQDFGVDFLDIIMRQDKILKLHDTESIALSIDENLGKYEQLKKRNNTRAAELHAAQPDRVYRGEIIDIQDDKVIQEISPGVAIEHCGIATGVRHEDIGQRFTIAYDNQSVSITRERQRDHVHEIDI